MLIPEERGGIGMSTVDFVAAMEQIGLADQPVAAAWQAARDHRLAAAVPGHDPPNGLGIDHLLRGVRC